MNSDAISMKKKKNWCRKFKTCRRVNLPRNFQLAPISAWKRGKKSLLAREISKTSKLHADLVLISAAGFFFRSFFALALFSSTPRAERKIRYPHSVYGELNPLWRDYPCYILFFYFFFLFRFASFFYHCVQ